MSMICSYWTWERTSRPGSASAGNMLTGGVVDVRLMMVAGFGAVGASLRYGIGVFTMKYLPQAPFVGTLTVNLLGCFAFGVLSQLPGLSPVWRFALLTGLLGAFTTFSAFSYDTIALYETRGLLWASGYVVLQNVLGITLALLGMSLGRAAFG